MAVRFRPLPIVPAPMPSRRFHRPGTSSPSPPKASATKANPPSCWSTSPPPWTSRSPCRLVRSPWTSAPWLRPSIHPTPHWAIQWATSPSKRCPWRAATRSPCSPSSLACSTSATRTKTTPRIAAAARSAADAPTRATSPSTAWTITTRSAGQPLPACCAPRSTPPRSFASPPPTAPPTPAAAPALRSPSSPRAEPMPSTARSTSTTAPPTPWPTSGSTSSPSFTWEGRTSPRNTS